MAHARPPSGVRQLSPTPTSYTTDCQALGGVEIAPIKEWLTAGAAQADYYDYSDSRGRMPTSVRLNPALEARLESLARITGRSKAFYLRELIEQGLDDLEDAYLGAAALEAHRRSGETAIPLAALMQDLGLED